MNVPAPPSSPFPPRGGAGVMASFRNAWAGLIHTVIHQRNMRVHLVSAVLVGLVGSGIPLGLAEKVTLIFCVLLIFFAEILNSA
ncbi:diacylglycerol kinase family protein, partial [Hyalangium sp.]|uniref:diacylglycerol kinase family protein n=1 Tax=Hyalangium sp. TaxID=2028555 RepID=UPI002D45E99E